MMIVPGASVVRYSTAVRRYCGSNSTESSGRSPGWSPTSGCCAKLCEIESVRPIAAITIQVRCRNLIIQTPFRRRLCIVVCQITDAIKSQAWLNGKRSGYAAGMALNFGQLGSRRDSLRREPEPSKEGGITVTLTRPARSTRCSEPLRAHKERTDQREAYAFRRPGGFPDRYGRWNDVRPQADC